MWGGYMWGGSWGTGGVLMEVLMGLLWIAILIGIAAVVWAVLRRNTSGSSSSATDSALRILEERYARGEIGKEEFEQKRRDLRG